MTCDERVQTKLPYSQLTLKHSFDSLSLQSHKQAIQGPVTG